MTPLVGRQGRSSLAEARASARASHAARSGRADVALRRTASDIEAVAAELQTADAARWRAPSTSTTSLLPEVVEQTVRELGGLDVLVNCVVAGTLALLRRHVARDRRGAIRFTVLSAYALVKAAVLHLPASARRSSTSGRSPSAPPLVTCLRDGQGRWSS
jgi:NAD(P)-dependent dehydrogenase (short-subunit alcohol dehydrogenase family)